MPFTPNLERLVARLDALSSYSSDSLAAVLAASPIERADVADFVRLDPANYRRNLVLRRDAYELRVLCWLPRQRTSLHGHQGSACAFRIVSGASTEIRLREPDRRWLPGDVVAENGIELVHQVTNLGDEPLVSIHAYSPALAVDQPAVQYTGRHVVIIGGAVSGATLAIHLLSRTTERLRITIVERRQGLGRGPAFGTTDPAFRLNVPAGCMSLYPDRPLHFVEWAAARLGPLEASALLPRQLFGEYVEDQLARAISGAPGNKVWFHRAEAIAADAHGVQLADGTPLDADVVVLATGNQLPAAPAALAGVSSSHVVRDPWSDRALETIPPDADVLLVGTGLTAVDVVLSLTRRGHRGALVALSRRGLLPLPELRASAPAAAIDVGALPRTARGLSAWVRTASAGRPWQSVIDGLRPHTQTIWDGLPLVERSRFLRKLRPFWEVHRHRASVEVLAEIGRLRAGGRLEVLAGALDEVREDAHGLEVRWTPRGEDRARTRRFARVVLCTGPETDVRRWTSALFQHLLHDDHIASDPLGLGIVTDDVGRPLKPDGSATPWLYAIGSLRRPRLWETTAVPDLVQQAVSLAHLLEPS